jgi:hypothetical protein
MLSSTHFYLWVSPALNRRPKKSKKFHGWIFQLILAGYEMALLSAEQKIVL